ncbi:MAG: alcohol dehydrogenase catalytic domain-containing protein [Bacillota bacterium]
MPRKSRAAVLEGIRKMSIQEFEIPNINSDDGLLRVEMVGVCGSDPGMYMGKFQVPFPIIMGHEIVGYIAEIGEHAAEKHGVKKGDRVVVEHPFGCGECYSCITGDYIYCEKNLKYGYSISCKDAPHLWGGYSEYLYIAPRAMVHKVSKDLPAEAAILICAIMGNAIRWVRMIGQVSIGDTVVVQGPGQQGLAAVIAAKESGASKIIVVGTSKDRRRLEMARKLGADYTININEEDPVAKVREISGGLMADAVVEVSGHPEALKVSPDLVRKKGTIIAAGLYGQKTEIPLIFDKLVMNEVKLQGVYSHDIRAVLPAIRLVESRRYPIEELVTHKFKLDEAEKAVQLVAGEVEDKEEPIKVAIVP